MFVYRCYTFLWAVRMLASVLMRAWAREDDIMQEWAQGEAIADECAREIITDVIGIHGGQIAEESAKVKPDAQRMARLEDGISRLSRERTNLQASRWPPSSASSLTPTRARSSAR